MRKLLLILNRNETLNGKEINVIVSIPSKQVLVDSKNHETLNIE